MKKWLALGVLGIAAFMAFAGSCTVVKIRLTEINGRDVFAGELQNDSGADILQHTYVVAFLDSNNSVVETIVVEGCLRSLQDGTSDWFSARSSVSSSTTTTALARLAFDGTLKIGTTTAGDITISNLRIRRLDDELRVSGTVKNNDSEELVDPYVCVVVKDNSGNIVVVAKVTNLNDLDEDETDDFSIDIAVPDSSTTVNRVDVHVDGLEDGKPTDPESDTNNTVTLCSDPTNTPTNTPVGPSATPTNTPDLTATPTATSTSTNTPTATPTPCF